MLYCIVLYCNVLYCIKVKIGYIITFVIMTTLNTQHMHLKTEFLYGAEETEEEMSTSVNFGDQESERLLSSHSNEVYNLIQMKMDKSILQKQRHHYFYIIIIIIFLCFSLKIYIISITKYAE